MLNKVCQLASVDEERCAIIWLQQNPSHVGKETMTERPMGVSKFRKPRHGTLGRSILAEGYEKDDFRSSNAPGHPLCLSERPLVGGVIRVWKIETDGRPCAEGNCQGRTPENVESASTLWSLCLTEDDRGPIVKGGIVDD